MTVAELIRILEDLPPGAGVYFAHTDQRKRTAPLTEQHLDLYDDDTLVLRHPGRPRRN